MFIKVTKETESKEHKYVMMEGLVNALDWNYMARDFTKLLTLDVFNVLWSNLVDFIPGGIE